MSPEKLVCTEVVSFWGLSDALCIMWSFYSDWLEHKLFPTQYEL